MALRQITDQGTEVVAAGFIVGELVVACAGRGEKNDIAGSGKVGGALQGSV